MFSNSWSVVFIISGIFVLFLGTVFGTAYILRKGIDSMSKDGSSQKIVSSIKTNDKSCDMSKILKDLEENNIDMNCKIKID